MTIAKQPKTSCFILCGCSCRLSGKRLQVLNALGKTVALLLRIKIETESYKNKLKLKKMAVQTNQCSTTRGILCQVFIHINWEQTKHKTVLHYILNNVLTMPQNSDNKFMAHELTILNIQTTNH